MLGLARSRAKVLGNDFVGEIFGWGVLEYERTCIGGSFHRTNFMIHDSIELMD